MLFQLCAPITVEHFSFLWLVSSRNSISSELTFVEANLHVQLWFGVSPLKINKVDGVVLTLQSNLIAVVTKCRRVRVENYLDWELSYFCAGTYTEYSPLKYFLSWLMYMLCTCDWNRQSFFTDLVTCFKFNQN